MRRIVLPLLLGAGLLIASAGGAAAHPLGNFTVNHYDGLRLFSDRVEDFAVVDTAEIPTLQEQVQVDADHDGQVSDAERASYAANTCSALATSIHATQPAPLHWSVRTSTFEYRPGAAGLQVSRLECRLSSPLAIGAGTVLTFSDDFQSDRIGWHEITAVTDGVHLDRSPVPARSVSDELRNYPNDLLSSPLAIRSASLTIKPGAGLSTSAGTLRLPVAGPLARRLNALSTHFTDLVGRHTLTPAVGLLAVLLSLVLGASHAMLPGHGKTVIAAYLAGRRGSIRDALTVGATVTITHTAGVIVLGLLLSGVAALAGETVLAYLGVVSGVMIAGIGAWLLATVLRRQRRARRAASRGDTGRRQRLDDAATARAAGLGGDTGAGSRRSPCTGCSDASPRAACTAPRQPRTLRRA